MFVFMCKKGGRERKATKEYSLIDGNLEIGLRRKLVLCCFNNYARLVEKSFFLFFFYAADI